MDVMRMQESDIKTVDNGGVDVLAVVFPAEEDGAATLRVYPPRGWRFNADELLWVEDGEITVGLAHLGAPGYEAAIEPPPEV